MRFSSSDFPHEAILFTLYKIYFLRGKEGGREGQMEGEGPDEIMPDDSA